MTGESNYIKFDKLEFLFNQQKSLINQEISKLEHENGEQQGSSTTTARAASGATSPPENKMKRLYEIKEPFGGYRIFMLSSALLHEVVELQRETDWKWWKTEKGIENQRIQEEVIDLWHFLIQLSIEAGLDPELLVAKYIQKNKENTKRQQQGY
ncbi:MAG TPA: dUTPase [Candidatus Nitrosocosmicus sp.]|nr:dUTPase [Candidatus Nitrosocosmicus sp.]